MPRINGKPVVLNADMEEIPLLDVRQHRCWENYANPKSKTYGNAYKSAVAAGFTPGYSRNITSAKFFQERLLRFNMLGRAEKVLKRALVLNPVDEQGKMQPELLRIQTDVAKHITKTLGKEEGYAERSEVTGKDGSPVVFMPAELMEKYGLEEKGDKNG